jgi:hypothetical protein
MTTFEPTKPIETQADLHAVWCGLMEPLGFSEQSIWMLRIAPDRLPIPQIVKIAEADDVPSSADGHGFPEVMRMLDEGEPGHSFAFLRSRPGRGVTNEDRAWAAFLHEAGRTAGVAVEVVHLATDDDLTPLPLDTLRIGRSASR